MAAPTQMDGGMQIGSNIANQDRQKEARDAKANSIPIKKGDVGYFLAIALMTTTKSSHDVKWSQSGRTRQENYTLIVFEYAGMDKTKPLCKGRLFVSAEALPRFKELLALVTKPGSTNPWHAFSVGDEFQYGQRDDGGADRFLVFHDKGNRPFQHKFVNSPWLKAGNLSLSLLDKAGFGSSKGLDFASELARDYFGDYLRNFD